MNCPICRKRLTTVEIEPGLRAQECENHGIWIPALNYWRWLATQQISYPPEINEGEFEAGEGDVKSGKVCSDCGQLLHRYAIGHGVSFHLDQCPKCAGIWLDSGEWDILKKKNLHNAMHFMFSEPWQEKVRKDRSQQQYEALFISKFGEELFDEVKAFKKKMNAHEQRDLILTYLSNTRE